MFYLIIALIALGCVAAVFGWVRNRKLQGMLRRGEIAEIPEAKEIPAVCCGQHEVCLRDTLLEAATHPVEYYDDEELDRFRGVEGDAYDEEAVGEFRDVLYTLREPEVPAWLASLQRRGVNLPDALRDEAMLLINS